MGHGGLGQADETVEADHGLRMLRGHDNPGAGSRTKSIILESGAAIS
jgi:hypothetical protein